MELGLEHRLEAWRWFGVNVKSFYPCFNGIRVGTKIRIQPRNTRITVSILVLMELGLEQTYTLPDDFSDMGVSILVLMELGLELRELEDFLHDNYEFLSLF